MDGQHQEKEVTKKEHVTRLQILPNYPKTNMFQQDFTSHNPTSESPIYENSELYGPSLTLSRLRPRGGIQSVPLYENLPFNKHQPVIRSRRRAQTLANGYSSYRQPAYHNRPDLLPVIEQRVGNFGHPEFLPPHSRSQPHRAGHLQETCYFV